MPPELDNDQEYASEEDSDFAPEDAQDRASSASEDEGESPDGAAPAATRTVKRQAGDGPEAEDAGFENSGDEAIITKGKKRRRKTKGKDGGSGAKDGEDDDEGGEGGLIKTRSMRVAEKVERRMAVASGPVTVDVDALWAQMTSGGAPAHATTSVDQEENQEDGDTGAARDAPPANQAKINGADEPSDLVRIKRTYNFAGKVHTEEKLVARDSAEAKLYLESLGENGDAAAAEDADSSPKRMPRRAFRSAFEPIIDQGSQRTDLNLGIAMRLQARELAGQDKARKLNTVEKSRMDWAGYVDKEGIKDELELAGKSKDSFTARQAFLARSEAIREEDARRARMAGRA